MNAHNKSNCTTRNALDLISSLPPLPAAAALTTRQHGNYPKCRRKYLVGSSLPRNRQRIAHAIHLQKHVGSKTLTEA